MLGWIDRSPQRHTYVVTPFHKDFSGTIFLDKSEVRTHKLELHTIVRIDVKRQKGHQYKGKVLEVFSSIDDNQLEAAIVEEQHGYPTEFSEQALKDAEEAQNFKPGKRRDLTRCVTVTIDGETARDFDDAISIEETSQGFNLKVSIADVSHFVREGTSLDHEAHARGTSIYFPDRCVPMLPEILSNNLCSLVPKQARFALTCEMEISKHGEVIKSQVYPSVIQSHERLTYTKVAQIIEEHKKDVVNPEIEKLLRSAHKLSLIIRKNRSARGSLDLDLPEPEFVLDQEGKIASVRQALRNEAHRLIEDFMILANEAVSELIEEHGYASIFRVHEDPDPLKIEKLGLIVQRFGFKLSEKKDLSESMQNFLDNVRGHQNEKMLVVSLLRSLKQAHYNASNLGHFGLGSESYCHFTSPIRRYPDLMIHRILRKSDFFKSGQSPYDFEKLQEIAKSCSETERRAFLAERDMEDLKKVRFMSQFVGKTFEGIIVSVKSFGMFVEIMPHFIEGMIPTRLLPHDYYALDDLEITLQGRRSRLKFRIGDKVKVHLQEVDRFKRQITFRYLNHIEGHRRR